MLHISFILITNIFWYTIIKYDIVFLFKMATAKKAKKKITAKKSTAKKETTTTADKKTAATKKTTTKKTAATKKTTTKKTSAKKKTSSRSEAAKKTGIETSIPEAAKNVIVDTNKQIIKAKSVQNQIIQASANAIQQNFKTWNDSASAFADLNRNILQSWISTFTQTRN